MTGRERLAAMVPWWSKVLIKLLLARFRLPYAAWRRLGIFRHGCMGDPGYAWRVYARHLEQYRSFSRQACPGEVLELGPGDSAFSGAFGAALGTRWTYLVDVRPFFRWDTTSREVLGTFLKEAHPELVLPEGPGLEDIRTEYLTAGLDSLRSLPDASVDFIWSQAVLEHLPRQAFPAFLAEMHRILRPDGLLSHRVDLKDHLGGGLNNLRFPEAVWESPWFQESGFYTNRLRRGELLSAFAQAGFEVAWLAEERWPRLPTSRKSLAPSFQSLSEDELLVSGLELVLRPLRGAP